MTKEEFIEGVRQYLNENAHEHLIEMKKLIIQIKETLSLKDYLKLFDERVLDCATEKKMFK